MDSEGFLRRNARLLALGAAAWTLSIAGCERDTGDKIEDKIEDAGDEVDDAVDDAEDAIDDAADDLEDGVR